MPNLDWKSLFQGGIIVVLGLGLFIPFYQGYGDLQAMASEDGYCTLPNGELYSVRRALEDVERGTHLDYRPYLAGGANPIVAPYFVQHQSFPLACFTDYHSETVRQAVEGGAGVARAEFLMVSRAAEARAGNDGARWALNPHPAWDGAIQQVALPIFANLGWFLVVLTFLALAIREIWT